MGGGGELEGFVKFIDLDGIQEPRLAFGKKTLSHSPFPGLPREAFVNKRNALSFFFFFFSFLITTCPVITIITYLGHLLNYSATKHLLSAYCEASTRLGPGTPEKRPRQGESRDQEQLRGKGDRAHSL